MDGLKAVNVYVIETDQSLVMIDGGWAIDASRRVLESSLRALGHRLSDISEFLVTHVHRDHYTQAVALRREYGSHVRLGIGDQATLRLLNSGTAGPDPTVTQLLKAGATSLAREWATRPDRRRQNRDAWSSPDTWLEGDHQLDFGSRTVEAMATPGHTQGHYVFIDRSAKLLFAGDHVLPTITPSIGFELAYASLPLGDYLNSLAKVRNLPDLTLLPAHGPVTTSSHLRIDELLEHHESRLALCAEAVMAGSTAYEVAQQLPWTRRGLKLSRLGLFNAALATMETAAHLELLAAQSRVSRQVEGGCVYYGHVSPTQRHRPHGTL